MWTEDPFKAKWSVIAKAYSTIRDYISKEEAPLDVFLALIAPANYLAVMGWDIVYTEDQGVPLPAGPEQLARLPRFPPFSDHDLIHFVARYHYLEPADAQAIALSSRPSSPLIDPLPFARPDLDAGVLT